MSIERDKDFEQLEDIAAMMAENPGVEFENGKYVYYGLDRRTAFAAVYISGAWAGWQAKANAVPEKDAVIKKLSDQLYAQEMKASAARVLCETACELLDDYAHQDAMVILNDLEQAMKEPK